MDKRLIYPEHYAKHQEIKDSINATINLINELGNMVMTGDEDIDNVYLLLYTIYAEVIDSLTEVEDRDYEK